MADIDFGGIGNLVSGVGGLFGKGGLFGPGGDPYGDLYKAQKVKYNVAREEGLHPLAVAGSPAGYAPAPMNTAQSAIDAGQAIASFGNKKQREKEQELIDAQIEEARSRTVLNQANARRALSGPQPGLGGTQGPGSEILSALERVLAGGDLTGRREPYRNAPVGQTVRVGNQELKGINPDVFEVGLSELIAGAIMYGPQYLYGLLDKGKPPADPDARRPGQQPNQPGYRP